VNLLKPTSFVMLAVLCCGAFAQSAKKASPVLSFALVAWRQYPQMRIEDAYKWLFHATQGGEHAITSEEGPRQWLEGEWKGLGQPLRGEPLLVPLTRDGRLVRMNLRPYKARGGSKETVLQAFVRSAKSFRADRAAFRAAWQSLGNRLKHRDAGRITRKDWLRFDGEMAKHGYPACSHSEAYERAYRPAYRVMLRSVWNSLQAKR
jgi:hypothetical protein